MTAFSEKAFHDAKLGRCQTALDELANGCDPNGRDCSGWPMIFVAANNGHLELVKALIAKGVDLAADVDGQETALDAARRRKHKLVEDVLMKAKARSIRAECEPAAKSLAKQLGWRCRILVDPGCIDTGEPSKPGQFPPRPHFGIKGKCAGIEVELKLFNGGAELEICPLRLPRGLIFDFRQLRRSEELQYDCPIQVFEKAKVGAFAASQENATPIQRFLSAGRNLELLTQFELRGRERFVATQEGFWLLCFERNHDELVKRIGLLAQLAAENTGAEQPPKRLFESAWRLVSSRSTKASGTGHSVCGTPRADTLCPKCSQPAQPIAHLQLTDKQLGQNPWPDAASVFSAVCAMTVKTGAPSFSRPN